MNKIFKLGCAALAIFLLGWGAIAYLNQISIPVLQPAGAIGKAESDLIITSTLLMLIVVVPVFILAGVFAWKYRESNRRARHDPDWEHNHIAECCWWGVPCVIIVILAILTWRSSHELDPFRPITSEVPPIEIQVVALDWKWLFIYPKQGIATVNFVQFPDNTPIKFDVTADAPMNSFWIPQLGGQIYAMPAMRSQLHLIADQPGSYRGASANISGDGFAGMTFTAVACSQAEFDAWVASTAASSPLNLNTYQELAKPSQYHPVTYYRLEKADLFDWILMKYMHIPKENYVGKTHS